ncbi:MAG TPA: bifunctional phosphoglucose/phosphomannose isomerase, partial [Flavobacteriales bacterium]|nr:bifunctional phosphoglucose/phosphomannose isomerase [Flavobacteriales bacterium]
RYGRRRSTAPGRDATHAVRDAFQRSYFHPEVHSVRMQQLIDAFPQQLKEALAIGRSAKLSAPSGPYTNVVVTGLGGSGIGGRIAAQVVAAEANCPIEVYSNYYLPAYVNHNSLVIACSYSGNTEETIASMEQALAKGARVCVVTSGGAMLEMAQKRGLDHIVIPGGNPPRTMLAYSLTQQFFVLHHFGIIGDGFEGAIKAAAAMLEEDKAKIQSAAKDLAEKLFGKRLVIYSEASTEAVSIRFRQQVNENSKELCWHHAIPEMNHNELVGWAGGKDDIAVVIFRHKTDHERSQIRMGINKEVFCRHTPHIHDVWSQGDTTIARQLYLINLGDWVSFYWAEKKGVDPSEIAVINMLKGKLAEVK